MGAGAGGKKPFLAGLKAHTRACVCIAAIAALAAWRLYAGDGMGDAGGGAANVSVDSGAQKPPDSSAGGISGRLVYFAGFEDSAFGAGTKLELANPEENGDFYMKYRIKDADTGKDCYESGLVASGRAVYWTPAAALGEGRHNLEIRMLPYYSPDDGQTWMPLTSTCNNVAFTILPGSGEKAGMGSQDAGETKEKDAGGR